MGGVGPTVAARADHGEQAAARAYVGAELADGSHEKLFGAHGRADERAELNEEEVGAEVSEAEREKIKEMDEVAKEDEAGPPRLTDEQTAVAGAPQPAVAGIADEAAMSAAAHRTNRSRKICGPERNGTRALARNAFEDVFKLLGIFPGTFCHGFAVNTRGPRNKGGGLTEQTHLRTCK